MSLLLTALLLLSFFFQHVLSACSTTSDVEFTFYGFPDGPSATTSFGCSGTKQVTYGTAGGSGTYANPETFATALTNTNFLPCEIIFAWIGALYYSRLE